MVLGGLEASSPTLDTQVVESGESAAQEYLSGVQARLSVQELRVHIVGTVGSPAVEIVDLSKRTGGSLVVMCTHGRSGMEH